MKKNLKKSEVMQYLREYNEQEIFYRKYKQNKHEQTLQNFFKRT